MHLEDYQIITHDVELSDESNPMIGEFKIHFMLRAPRSHIATDIRTGFPNLIKGDRDVLDSLVKDHFIYYTNFVVNGEAMRPLTFIDEFLLSLESRILDVFADELEELFLESTSVTVFTDILTQQLSWRKHSRN